MDISREQLADALHRAICEKRGELVGHKRDMDIVLAERILAELKR